MRKLVMALVAAPVALVGCGGGVEGSPVAAERWDPCSITSEALQATGLDPEYRMVGWGRGVEVPEWDRCVFHAVGGVDYPYGLNVMSSAEHTIAESRANPSHFDGHDLEVGGRDAYMYRTDADAVLRDCNVSLEVPYGVVVFTALYNTDDGVDACAVVMKHVNDLESMIPSTPK